MSRLNERKLNHRLTYREREELFRMALMLLAAILCLILLFSDPAKVFAAEDVSRLFI